MRPGPRYLLVFLTLAVIFAGAFLLLPGLRQPDSVSGATGDPTITSVSPASGAQGQTMNVAIVGTTTAFANGTSVASFGAGITVNSTTVTDATHASANITIAASATAGARSVNVVTGTQTPIALANGFTVRDAKIVSIGTPSGAQGQTVSVAIVGTSTAFAQGASVASFGAGITVNSTTVTDTAHATANITISAAAVAGTRDVNVITGGETPDPLVGGFTVRDAKIVSIGTPSGAQGQTVSVAIVGTSTAFAQGASVASFGAGITVNSTTVTDAAHATANITITAGAAAGPRDVNVATSGETPDPLVGAFVVRDARILSVSPTSGAQGQVMTVEIVAADTAFVQGGSAASFGAGITVNSTTVTDPTHATASITISSSAAAGARTVNIVTGTEAPDALASAFTVRNARIASVSPTSAVLGQTLEVAIAGADTSFANGTSVASFGAGITVNATTVTDPTHATSNITVQAGAATGARSVSVTTGSEVADALTGGFTVRNPRIVSVAPSAAIIGETLNVAITGEDTAFVDGTSVATFGAGITVNSTSVSDSTHAIASITVSGGAVPGARDIGVATGSESAVPLSGGFTVGDSRIVSVDPSSVWRGDNVDVMVSGNGTSFEQGTSQGVIGGQGVTVNAVTVTDATHATLNLTVDPGASLESRDVNITTGAQVPQPLRGGLAIGARTPELVDMVPAVSLEPGATVTLSGRYLGTTRGTSYVSFGGIRAGAYASWSDGEIVVQVPADVTSGLLTVVNEGGTSNGLAYSVLAPLPAPLVNTIVPAYGGVGAVITITGRNFGTMKLSGGKATSTGSAVLFNGKPAAAYVQWTDTLIKAIVPEGATPGPVTVVTAAGESNTSVKTVFAVTTPTWYLAEGTTAYGFDTRLSIQNPNASSVKARVTYMTNSGPVVKPDLDLPPRSQTTIDPASDLGEKDFSTRVESLGGLGIAVDRTMTWTGSGASSPEAHSSVGVTAPAKTWYLAEGSSDWGFESWLLIQNPNPSAANCDVTYMIEGEGPRTIRHQVPANSRASFGMESDIGKEDASIKVTSDVGVIPERAMYRNDRREGHDSIGTTAPALDYYLAEGTTDWGFTTYVLVQNPNDRAADVTLTYMTAKDGAKTQPTFTMPANSRKTIRVNDVLPQQDMSTRVHATRPIIAERAMYWNNGSGEACHDSIGMSAAHTMFYLPDGQTSEGWETWTLVQNPNPTAVTIEVTYMTPSGEGNVVFTDSVPANSRKSFGMGDRLASGKAAVMVISKTAGKRIIAERAMYSNSRGAGTDTAGGWAD